MGKFNDLVKDAGTPKPEDWPEAWATQFPLLAEAMFPEPGKASGTYVTPRYSVTLFTQGKLLTAVVGAKDGPRKFWVTLDGPEAALEQVELALKSGKGEWREQEKDK
jgi:hypothetical protein